MSMNESEVGKLKPKRLVKKPAAEASDAAVGDAARRRAKERPVEGPSAEAAPAEAPRKFQFDTKAIVDSPAFIPAVIAVFGLGLVFWRMIAFLPELWLSDDGYYSHGFLVPLISVYVIWRAWPRIKDRPVKPAYWAIIPLLGLMYLALVAKVTGMQNVASVTLVATLWTSVLFVAGGKWLKALFFPIGYLLFALPVWSMVIDNYTNPMQLASTKVAFKMLELCGLQPFMSNESTIYLNNFILDIGVPCSGLKLILALGAFTIFFVLVARLKWWGNAFMLAIMFPLALLINGLRIALIGIVGNEWGPEAGGKFHDWSGYLTLVLCFFVLFKIARGLGWKD